MYILARALKPPGILCGGKSGEHGSLHASVHSGTLILQFDDSMVVCAQGWRERMEEDVKGVM